MNQRQDALDGRERLLKAAAEIFAQVGFAGASVGDIARSAGVTQPLVNHHFGSKRGLFEAVIDGHFADLERTLHRCEEESAGQSEVARLRAMLRAYVLFCGLHPYLSRVLRIESQSGLAHEVNQRWQRRFVEFFEARLARAAAGGVLAPVNPCFLFFAVVGVATELFSQPDLAASTFSVDVTHPSVIEDAADFACDFILKGAGARVT